MEEDSVIGDFYPREFALDLNGKRRLWQAVVLLPFIDEQRLLEHVRPLEDELTGEERKRNSLGYAYLFMHSSAGLASLAAAAPAATPPDAPPPTPPNPAKMNELAAAVMRAELDDDVELGAKLREELEVVRQAAADYIAWGELKKGLPIDPGPEYGQGMSGAVAKPPDTVELGEPYEPPPFAGDRVDHRYRPRRLEQNRVLCVVYNPPPFKPHRSVLLPTVKMPNPELRPGDVPIIEQGRTIKPLRMRAKQQERPFFLPGAADRMARHNMQQPRTRPPGPGRGGGGYGGRGNHHGGRHGGGGYSGRSDGVGHGSRGRANGGYGGGGYGGGGHGGGGYGGGGYGGGGYGGGGHGGGGYGGGGYGQQPPRGPLGGQHGYNRGGPRQEQPGYGHRQGPPQQDGMYNQNPNSGYGHSTGRRDSGSGQGWG